ncbi:uncharacterized protein LOC114378270 isoform X2 [Glycine soja]|uniref:Uncharacterized protein n=1 Tax=Glycine soja TaxID=3848 RepID=A0A445HMU8_GLYSO|nr:uncharacterized protein LOC114378270 isoform X2 [Glycine soja]RZB75041.1 hypothetical protein D0Y65_033789 [Glycine soja]
MEMSINWSSISPNIRETQGPNIPAVDIAGTARLMWWNHNFMVHVDSHVTVDSVFLDVIDQENTSELEVFTARPRGVSNEVYKYREMLAFLVVFIYISRGLCLMMAREAGEACSQGSSNRSKAKCRLRGFSN